MDRTNEQNTLENFYQQTQSAITKAVWKNENLRSEFVKNPKATIERELGLRFPEEINVQCIDESDPSTVYYILHPHPNQTLSTEFSDEQLDAIAGGFGMGDFGALLSGIGAILGVVSMFGNKDLAKPAAITGGLGVGMSAIHGISQLGR